MTEEQQNTNQSAEPETDAPVGGNPQDNEAGAADTPKTSAEENSVDQEVEDSFPASDPPANY